MLNSTSLNKVSNVTLLEPPDIVFLFVSDIDDDSLLEFFGVSTSSSETLSVYSIMEAVPPVVDIISPANGSYARTDVFVDISASDEHSGIYAVELLINGTSHGYYYPPYDLEYDIYWNATDYPEGTYNLTVIAYDNVNNIASKSIFIYLDKTPPSISVVEYPPEVREGKEATINVTIGDTGSGVSEVSLSYSVDGGVSWINVTMVLIGEDVLTGGGIYEVTIPRQFAGTTAQFKIIAIDAVGNVAVSSIYSYEVVSEVAPPEEEAPEVSWTLIGGIGVTVAVIAAVAFIVARRR